MHKRRKIEEETPLVIEIIHLVVQRTSGILYELIPVCRALDSLYQYEKRELEAYQSELFKYIVLPYTEKKANVVLAELKNIDFGQVLYYLYRQFLYFNAHNLVDDVLLKKIYYHGFQKNDLFLCQIADVLKKRSYINSNGLEHNSYNLERLNYDNPLLRRKFGAEDYVWESSFWEISYFYHFYQSFSTAEDLKAALRYYHIREQTRGKVDVVTKYVISSPGTLHYPTKCGWPTLDRLMKCATSKKPYYICVKLVYLGRCNAALCSFIPVSLHLAKLVSNPWQNFE